MTPLRGSTRAADHKRRLPPQWWVKRRMKVERSPSGGWCASYRWRSQGWSCIDDTRDGASQGLLDYVAGVRDGSLLAEYYARSAQ